MRGRVQETWRCWGYGAHSQPATLSFWWERCCPQCWWALAGHGEAGRACAGLAVGALPGAQGAPEGLAGFRRRVVSCAGKPSPSRVTNSRQGAPFCL